MPRRLDDATRADRLTGIPASWSAREGTVLIAHRGTLQRWRIVVLLAVMAITACAPQETRPPAVGATASVADALQRRYDDFAASGQPVFDVDPQRSVLVMEVRRAGSLANLGHDHVVASHDLRGHVAPAEGRADLFLRADELSVDEPALRKAAGFDTEPSASDIAGTRRNMLTRVLQAEQHPLVVVSVTGVRPGATSQILRPTLSVNGVERAIDAQALVEVTSGEMRVTGEATILQTDFGIRPFSILGGALEVADAITVRFEIVARKRKS